MMSTDHYADHCIMTDHDFDEVTSCGKTTKLAPVFTVPAHKPYMIAGNFCYMMIIIMCSCDCLAGAPMPK